VDDFHIQAYPSQVFFDENGNYITYMMGAIGQDMIDATFKARDRIE
jgi:thioredoxin-related protein